LSYVIQNFYEPSKKISLTPRFKILLIFKNIEKFIIFLKFNTLFYYTHTFHIFKFTLYLSFFKYFFSKLYIKWIYNLNFELVNNYTSNQLKSSIFGIFSSLNFFLSNKAISPLSNLIKEEYFFNQYFGSIKTLNTRLNNTFFKNDFFFQMLVVSCLWHQYSQFSNFHSNFIVVINNLKTFRFYGGYFLKVYSY